MDKIIDLQIQTQVTVPGLQGINLNIPGIGGLFGDGVLFGLGLILQILFGLFLLIWIFLSIFAAMKIIQSQGNAEGIQEGFKKIKTIWIGVASVLVFFVGLSLVGTIFGFGNATEWGNTLAQCGGATGPFYFAQTDQQRIFYKSRYGIEVPTSEKAYCCIFDQTKHSAVYPDSGPLPTNPYAKFYKTNTIPSLGINSDGPTWVLPIDNSISVDSDGNMFYKGGSTGFSQCQKYGGQ